eukprot:CAMPEP_0171689818 /NCGR_PEP_ID=MMETSP0991-20121206/4661_1 /TAXON_ID=483369 /ORGANISM="non described non described, Strain CCMP2098" /LENGTH=179 /DNA_ID=CAMNT_0012277911 /DNA_START=77 /DNA_END=612 /DNA_ORIENTATION=+
MASLASASSGGGDPPLPSGWASATTADGKVYYKNHKERTTQWHHPLLARSGSETGPEAGSGTSQGERAPAVPKALNRKSNYYGSMKKSILEGISSAMSSIEFGEEEPSKPIQIGSPTDFRHITHVKTDASSATGFSGLPQKWETVFLTSGISQSEAAANPAAVLDALGCFIDGPALPSG